MNENFQSAIDMSVSTLGQDLMSLVLQEIKALPDVWQRLPEYRQAEVIERIRLNVEQATGKAVTLIASQGCQRVFGTLDKVTLADKTQAVVLLHPNNEMDALHELYNSTKQLVSIVLAAPDQFTGGMDQIQPDPDQTPMDFGDDENALEYQD